MLSYLITRHEAMAISPFEVMFGRQVSTLRPEMEIPLEYNPILDREQRKAVMTHVRSRQDKAIVKMKRKWDTSNTIVSSFVT